MFPDDGHPDLASAVRDVTGDGRDEIGLWDQTRVWIYTQDRPFNGPNLYRPVRNPHFNDSNYRATVSLPHAKEDRAWGGLRGQPLKLWDISFVKQVPFNDRLRAQIRVELRNAFNHPVFNNPNTDPTNANFGKVTSQANLPRDIQLAAKIIF